MKQILFFTGFMIFSSIIFAQGSEKPFNPAEYLKNKDSVNQSLIGKPYPAFEYKGMMVNYIPIKIYWAKSITSTFGLKDAIRVWKKWTP
jgi:hypothetical protein